VEVHRELSGFLRVGQELAEVDAFVGRQLKLLGAKSCFLKYRVPRLPPFPSQACLSVNACVVHGTAASLGRPLRAGDVLKVDIGTSKNGWIGDAAWTYVFGEPDDEVRRLCEAGKESLRRGIEELRPGNKLISFAKAVQGHVEGECGFHLVRGLGGHGYGRRLHESPWVSNVVPSWPGEWPDALMEVKAGMLLAVEPMLAVGTGMTESDPKGWPIYSADGSMTVHYEADVAVGEDGPIDLTAGLGEIEDVILR
jgi:methionyl aminopeptidase